AILRFLPQEGIEIEQLALALVDFPGEFRIPALDLVSILGLKFGLVGKLLFAQGLGAALGFAERQRGKDQPIADEAFLIGLEALIRVGGCDNQNQDSNR